MELYAGLAAPLNCSSIRIVDAKGRIAKEAKVLSEPEALGRVFPAPGEAGAKPSSSSEGAPGSAKPGPPTSCALSRRIRGLEHDAKKRACGRGSR